MTRTWHFLIRGKQTSMFNIPIDTVDRHIKAGMAHMPMLCNVHVLNFWISIRILGNRISELEKKIKTLEVAGLWNISSMYTYEIRVLWTTIFSAIAYCYIYSVSYWFLKSPKNSCYKFGKAKRGVWGGEDSDSTAVSVQWGRWSLTHQWTQYTRI